MSSIPSQTVVCVRGRLRILRALACAHGSNARVRVVRVFDRLFICSRLRTHLCMHPPTSPALLPTHHHHHHNHNRTYAPQNVNSVFTASPHVVPTPLSLSLALASPRLTSPRSVGLTSLPLPVILLVPPLSSLLFSSAWRVRAVCACISPPFVTQGLCAASVFSAPPPHPPPCGFVASTCKCAHS